MLLMSSSITSSSGDDPLAWLVLAIVVAAIVALALWAWRETRAARKKQRGP